MEKHHSVKKTKGRTSFAEDAEELQCIRQGKYVLRAGLEIQQD